MYLRFCPGRGGSGKEQVGTDTRLATPSPVGEWFLEPGKGLPLLSVALKPSQVLTGGPGWASQELGCWCPKWPHGPRLRRPCCRRPVPRAPGASMPWQEVPPLLCLRGRLLLTAEPGLVSHAPGRVLRAQAVSPPGPLGHWEEQHVPGHNLQGAGQELQADSQAPAVQGGGRGPSWRQTQEP